MADETVSKEMMNFAQLIADCMVQDGLTAEQYAEMPDEWCQAYMDVAIRKFEKFQTTYTTNPKAREAFVYSTFATLKAELNAA